jgi:VWFA-related protein
MTLLAVLRPGALLSQEPAPLVRTSANEVVVDVVVRDKRGRLVRGLKAQDFAVSEDGAPQTIVSIREVTSGLGPAGETGLAPDAPRPTTNAVDPSRPIRLFTLVFDRLGLDSRRLARQAALDLLREELGPNVFLAVFNSDLRLTVVEAFTNDRDRLRAAIGRATGGAPTDYANAAVDLQLAAGATAGGEGSSEAATASRGQSVDGGGMANEAMSRMINDMLEFTENSTREQQGRSSIFALWGIVKEQQRLPGRKTLLYFSEGLQLPNALVDQFHNMISSANRANVSIYAIDARGLSAGNDNALGQQMLAKNLRVSQGNYRSGQSTQNEAVTREQVMQFDRAQDAIRANPQVALAELAESTGGFLMANTNDFRQPLRRLAEESGSHYELIYKPANGILDGRFRSISVRLPKGDFKVQARNGYYALPLMGRQMVLPFEVPLLNALGSSPLPKGLDYGVSVLRFRSAGGAYQAGLVFDLPLHGIAFRENETKTAYRTHFSFLALLKDEQGQVVGKISRDLPMEEPREKLAGFQMGRAIFTRPLQLRPGRYTLESAAVDREGRKVAARRTSVIVPAAPEGKLGISALTLIRRVEPAPAEPEPQDPFLAGANRIVPMVESSVPGGPGQILSLYFVIYPEGTSGAPPVLSIDFFRDGERAGGGQPPLSAPLADGRIPYIANTPLDSFAPGLYEVRATVTQGSSQARQSLFVTIR